jgi:hypothetical protein
MHKRVDERENCRTKLTLFFSIKASKLTRLKTFSTAFAMGLQSNHKRVPCHEAFGFTSNCSVVELIIDITIGKKIVLWGTERRFLSSPHQKVTDPQCQ